MLSNDRSTKLIFHYFYIIYYYYWFTELQLNRCIFSCLFYYLFIKYCSLRFLKSPSRSVFNIFCWLLTCVLYLLDQHSLVPKLVLRCDWIFSVGRIQTGHTCLFVEGRGDGAGFCYCTCCNKYIDWIQVCPSS